MLSYLPHITDEAQVIHISDIGGISLSYTGTIAVICLILVLGIYELTSVSRIWKEHPPLSLSVAKWPLFIAFLAIFAFKAAVIIISLSS